MTVDDFEYEDVAGDRLTVKQSSVGPLVFEIHPDGEELQNVVIDQRDRDRVADLREKLGAWLDENQPEFPTKIAAVITADVVGTPTDWPHRRRTLARMSGGGHVWRDLDNGSLYTDDELENFEVKFEGVGA